jgi:hypothetical protein
MMAVALLSFYWFEAFRQGLTGTVNPTLRSGVMDTAGNGVRSQNLSCALLLGFYAF